MQVAKGYLTASPDHHSCVELDVVDARGVIVPQANNKIDFAVSGPVALVGLDGGDATNHASHKGVSHAAFGGELMAIVQSTTTGWDDHLEGFVRFTHRGNGNHYDDSSLIWRGQNQVGVSELGSGSAGSSVEAA